MRLHNFREKLLKSAQTKSGNWPRGKAVTLRGPLVYIDPVDTSANIVENTQILPLIGKRGWRPLHLCRTFTMISDNIKQSKVVRYSGSTEKQSIQWDDQGKPLYSSDSNPKYLIESKIRPILLPMQ